MKPPEAVLSIVSAASVRSDQVADGRPVPFVILDSSEYPEFDALVAAHQSDAMGAETTQWITIGDSRLPSTAMLLCAFQHPITCSFAIEFKLPESARLLDFVLCSNGTWIQPGGPDHRPATAFTDGPSIFLATSADFAAWDNIYQHLLVQELEKMGHSSETATALAPQLIAEERQLPERQ